MAGWTRVAFLAATICTACAPEPLGPPVKSPPPAPPTNTQAAVAPPPPEPSIEERRASAHRAMDAKDWNKAKEELQALLVRAPGDVLALQELGSVSASLGDKKAATEAYLAASKADGGRQLQLALAAAQGLYGQRRFDDLIGLMLLATSSNEAPAPTTSAASKMALWMWLALGQEAKEDFGAAAATYKRLTQTYPEEPRLWALLALAEGSGGKLDDAKQTAKTALQKWMQARSPKSVPEVELGHGAKELAMIARSLRRGGDAPAAISALSRYPVPKDEAAPMLEVEWALAKRALKDAPGAKAAANRAIAAGGEVPVSGGHLALAGLAVDAKKTDEARSQLQAYSQSAGDDRTYAQDAREIQAGLHALETTRPASAGPVTRDKPPGD